MATKKEVEAKLRELIRKLDQADQNVKDSLADSLPEPKTIVVKLPDLDTTYWAKIDGGAMGKLKEGAPDRSDIRIRANSDDLVAVLDGRRSMFSAVMAGSVKVDASLSDIIRLRRLA